jgi:hypothetical protein
MPGFQRMEAMARHLTYSVAFKRQVAQEYIAGESLHGLGLTDMALTKLLDGRRGLRRIDRLRPRPLLT